MFYLRICRYSLGSLTTEILKEVKKGKMYMNKRYQGSGGQKLDIQICLVGLDLRIFENLPWVSAEGGGGGGRVTLGTDWDMNESI